MVDKPMVDKDIEATRWFAATRRGVMLHDERARYDEWLRDPRNADSMAVLQAIWLDLAPQPSGADAVEPVPCHPPVHHRRQLAAMVAFVSVTATILARVDGGWLNTLDWWSR